MRVARVVSTAVVVALAGGGCDGGGPSGPPSPAVVREPLQLEAGSVARDRRVGEPCESGKAQCLSNLCLNTRPRGGGGRICSKLCGPGRPECEPGQVCIQGHPSDDGYWCVPATPSAGQAGGGR